MKLGDVVYLMVWDETGEVMTNDAFVKPLYETEEEAFDAVAKSGYYAAVGICEIRLVPVDAPAPSEGGG